MDKIHLMFKKRVKLAGRPALPFLIFFIDNRTVGLGTGDIITGTTKGLEIKLERTDIGPLGHIVEQGGTAAQSPFNRESQLGLDMNINLVS